MKNPGGLWAAVGVTVAILAVGCGSGSSAPAGPPVVAESPQLKGKVGVIVADVADEWVAKELDVMKKSPFFAGGLEVAEVKTTDAAMTAVTSLKGQGCSFVVLLGHEGGLDGQRLIDAAEAAQLKLAILHWRLFGTDNKPVNAPFIGIHEVQIADSLAQTALKSPLSAKAKVLYVGDPVRHADFFARADATLSTKISTKTRIEVSVPPGKTIDEYQALVTSSLKGQSMSQPWLVLALNDAYALGAGKALAAAGAKEIVSFGVGTTSDAQKAWESDAPYALNASILLNPYPEVKALARVLLKWEQTGAKSREILVGGTITQKDTYANLIQGMIKPAAGDEK